MQNVRVFSKSDEDGAHTGVLDNTSSKQKVKRVLISGLTIALETAKPTLRPIRAPKRITGAVYWPSALYAGVVYRN